MTGAVQAIWSIVRESAPGPRYAVALAALTEAGILVAGLHLDAAAGLRKGDPFRTAATEVRSAVGLLFRAEIVARAPWLPNVALTGLRPLS
jgi:hypothetical protein